MIRKKTIGDIIFDSLNAIILIMLMVVCIYPILYVTFASFSEPKFLLKHTGMLFSPMGFTVKGYQLVFKNPNIINGYKNTFFYTAFGTVLNVLLTSMGAYVLSRKRVKFKNAMMFIITFTMYFSGGLIPFYLLVKNLGMMDNRLALIIPTAISTWNLIIMRTSFMAIPDSLEESAKIDGANDFTILFRIILPLSKAVLAVISLYYIVGHWNAWFNAMIFFRNRKLYPLQLILREILISNDTNSMTNSTASEMSDGEEYRLLVQYCTIVVATAPILFVYPFLQKYFVKGVMIGSIKG